MTPERPNGEGDRDEDAPLPAAEVSYALCIFATETFPPSPAAVRRSLGASGADADIAIARFERAFRRSPELRRLGSCDLPVERLNRGVRVRLDPAVAEEAVAEVEAIARRHGLAVLDEKLDEISFPSSLDALEHFEEATRALCAAGSGYLMIEGGGGDRYFVQAFAEDGGREIRVEAVGNRALPRSWKLPRSIAAELDRQGWRPPRGAEVNFSATLPIGPRGTPRRLAKLLHDALAGAYGLAATARVTICLSLG
ncbi:MAG TPA: hypothetical protein VHO67_16385 [Polyangia bacterium]|nr:hypothetical protein [Polyangia bacterium]